MTDVAPVPPLVHELTVGADPAHAFTTWVDRAAQWWPAGHTVSGGPAAVVFEPRPGGRVYERGPDGAEHVWGEVLGWDPPHRLELLWHLFFPRSEATHVVVTFTAEGSATRVRIEQTGWEALGSAGPARRERTQAGWAATTAGYRALLAAEHGAEHGARNESGGVAGA